MSNFTAKQLIEEVESLPSEERAFIADSILKTLNPVNEEVQNKWLEVAEKRLQDLKSEKITGIPEGEVFGKIKERFSK